MHDRPPAIRPELPEFSDSREEPYWPGSRPLIILDEFVRATLDGAIGDERISTQGDALAAVVKGLVARAGRPLTESERSKVELETAVQWNARAEQVAPVCDVCKCFIDSPADVTHFRRAVGPEVVAHRRCAEDDLRAAFVVVNRYGLRGLRAVAR